MFRFNVNLMVITINLYRSVIILIYVIAESIWGFIQILLSKEENIFVPCVLIIFPRFYLMIYLLVKLKMYLKQVNDELNRQYKYCNRKSKVFYMQPRTLVND
jgi:hypothetical protein